MVHEQTRMEKRRDARAEAILGAALGVVVREGVDGLTLQGVASELGYATTALYRYFPSKGALLAALQRRVIVAIHGRLRAALEGAREEAVRRRWKGGEASLLAVVALVEAYLALPGSMPGELGLVNLMMGDPRLLLPGDEAQASAPVLRALLLEVGAVLEGAREAGALEEGPAGERTLALWAMLHGATQLAKLGRVEGVELDVRAVGRQGALALLVGWGAKPEALRRAVRALGENFAGKH